MEGGGGGGGGSGLAGEVVTKGVKRGEISKCWEV